MSAWCTRVELSGGADSELTRASKTLLIFCPFGGPASYDVRSRGRPAQWVPWAVLKVLGFWYSPRLIDGGANTGTQCQSQSEHPSKESDLLCTEFQLLQGLLVLR